MRHAEACGLACGLKGSYRHSVASRGEARVKELRRPGQPSESACHYLDALHGKRNAVTRALQEFTGDDCASLRLHLLPTPTSGADGFVNDEYRASMFFALVGRRLARPNL